VVFLLVIGFSSVIPSKNIHDAVMQHLPLVQFLLYPIAQQEDELIVQRQISTRLLYDE